MVQFLICWKGIPPSGFTSAPGSPLGDPKDAELLSRFGRRASLARCGRAS